MKQAIASYTPDSLNPKDLRSMADGLFRLMERASIRPSGLAKNPIPLNRGMRPSHNQRLEGPETHFRNRILWNSEGEDEKLFQAPSKPMELQILRQGELFRFHGKAALKRLAFLAPTFFSPYSLRREGSVGLMTIDGKAICFYTTNASAQRSLLGASSRRVSNICDESFRLPPTVKGSTRCLRFYQCVAHVFTFFQLMHTMFKIDTYLRLRVVLIQNMVGEGKCQSTQVCTFSNALNCILRGRAENRLEHWILSRGEVERAYLWKTRRLLFKDDNDELINIKLAIDRMCGDPWGTIGYRSPVAEDALARYAVLANEFISTHEEKLRDLHDRHPLHRSSASLFFSRATGGGASELALITGLHRLSEGRASPLVDVFGGATNQIDIHELWAWTQESNIHREEMLSACDWFLDQCKMRNVSFPYICIYPEREPKGRTFMILPYALQQPGAQAAAVLSEFFRSFKDTEEVFKGFRTSDLWSRMQLDMLDERSDTIMSLDSAVATDPLPHEWCRKIFEPFYRIFSPLTRKAIGIIFNPLRVHAAKGRPKSLIDTLAFEASVSDGLNLTHEYVEISPPKNRGRNLQRTIRFYIDAVPSTIRVFAQRHDIVEAITRYRRVLLKSPTGSGKTVLAATLFKSIIQFPSVAAIEIFSNTLKHFKAPHVVYYAKVREVAEQSGMMGEVTILCTSFYVEQLHGRFTDMLVVLDEAETKQERSMYNLVWTRLRDVPTLIMSATPEELLHEEGTYTVNLDGGTNFPIEECLCTEKEMIRRLMSAESPPSLICTYSEPHCRKLERALVDSGKKIICLTAQRRQTDYLSEINEAHIIISTNTIRSSVTLPNLIEVYDIGKIYEKVDFPLAGFESLTLFDVSDAMRTQLRGRVGRTQPGTYWRVSSETPSEPYTPKALDRNSFIASLLGKVSIQEFPRELNEGSLLIERFTQEMIPRFGGKYIPHKPIWVSFLRAQMPNRQYLRTLCYFIGFEESGIANRIQQLRDNEDILEAYNHFERFKHEDYNVQVFKLFEVMKERPCGFANEIFQIEQCYGFLLRSAEPGADCNDPHWTAEPSCLQILAVCLWRQLAIFEDGHLKGLFRKFSISTPTNRFGVSREYNDKNYYLVVGMTLMGHALNARACLVIPKWILLDIVERIKDPVHIRADLTTTEIVTFGTRQTRKGSQRKSVYLQWNKYNTSFTFEPKDYERIWKHMLSALARNRVGKVCTTTRGSPMSSTASFSVLNGFGLAANIVARQNTGEAMKSASVFGDDALVIASRKACDLVRATREHLGLQTKEEATGYLPFRDETLRETALAVFTERLFAVRQGLIRSMRPSGLVRLYHAYHQEDLFLWEPTYLPDMLHYDTQVQREEPELYSHITAPPVLVRNLHARRETAPRSILRRAFSSRIHKYDRLAEGPDVQRLLDHMEAVLLLRYPSTRGEPDRILDSELRLRRIPAIAYNDAIDLAEKLQGNGCFFKLRGPPLKFTSGEFAQTAARNIAIAEGRNPPMERLLADLGWGGSLPRPLDEDDLSEPLDYYDVIG